MEHLKNSYPFIDICWAWEKIMFFFNILQYVAKQFHEEPEKINKTNETHCFHLFFPLSIVFS